MALTVQPQIWGDWVVTEMVKIANIVTSPYIEFDTGVSIKEGEILLRIPKLKSLDVIGDDVRVTKTTQLTPNELEDYAELAPILRTGNAIQVTDVEIVSKGIDPLQALAPQIAQYNINQIQKKVKAVFVGVFASALATSHTYNASGIGDGKIDAGPIEDALQSVLGETSEGMTAMIMHSKVAADLKKKGLTYTILAPVFTDGLLTQGQIPTYWGKRIIVNDTICAPFTVDNVTYYPTYILGGQPAYVGFQKALNIYSDFDPSVGGGTNKLYWYSHFAVGFRGVSFSAGIDNPTTAQLATGSNWTKVAPDDKLIRVVRLITK